MAFLEELIHCGDNFITVIMDILFRVHDQRATDVCF